MEKSKDSKSTRDAEGWLIEQGYKEHLTTKDPALIPRVNTSYTVPNGISDDQRTITKVMKLAIDHKQEDDDEPHVNDGADYVTE